MQASHHHCEKRHITEWNIKITKSNPLSRSFYWKSVKACAKKKFFNLIVWANIRIHVMRMASSTWWFSVRFWISAVSYVKHTNSWFVQLGIPIFGKQASVSIVCYICSVYFVCHKSAMLSQNWKSGRSQSKLSFPQSGTKFPWFYSILSHESEPNDGLHYN